MSGATRSEAYDFGPPAALSVAFAQGPRSMASVILDAEEAERRRIARDVHDVTLQELVGIQFGIDAIRRDLARGSDVENICSRLQTAISSVQRDLRTLSYVLHPPELERDGLAFALRVFAEGFGRRTGLPIRYCDTLRGERVDQEMEIALYRVAREALFNVARHARASAAEIKLTRTAHGLDLTVSDNGVGIDATLTRAGSVATCGVGLGSMRERIAALGGTLTIRRLARGTLVGAAVPIEREGLRAG